MIMNDMAQEQQTGDTTEGHFEYKLLNKDVEMQGKYFDVVPDGNLFTLDDYPIFAVRMRPFGIDKIMDIYNRKYNIKTSVLTYKLNTNQYMLYSNNSRQMYLTQKEQLLKFFNFDELSNNEFIGLIITIVNEDNRLVHAVPYVYGKVDGRKKIIFLDAFGGLNCFSGCIIGAGFFQQNITDIDCYCHGNAVQGDHHSCGIIACDFVKNCLRNNAKLTYKILRSVKMRTVVRDFEYDQDIEVNVYELPAELKKFSQLGINKAKDTTIKDTKNEEEKQQRIGWFSNHIRKLMYRRDPEPYNPDGQIVPDAVREEKQINTSLLEKGHKYAGWIMKEEKLMLNYNPKYWLDMIRGQNIDNIFLRFVKQVKKLVEDIKVNETNE